MKLSVKICLLWYVLLTGGLILAFIGILTGCEQDSGKKTGKIAPVTKADAMALEQAPVATVNGNDISLDLFNTLYKARIARLASNEKLTVGVALHYKKIIANELIDDQLIRAEAEKRNVTVTQKEVAAALAKRATGFPSEKRYKKYLEAFPGGKDRLLETTKTRLLAQRLISNVPSVNDEEARRYYHEHSSLFNVSAHLTVQDIVILVRPDASQEQKQESMQKAEQIRIEALKPKVSFTVLARRHSQVSSAIMGGYRGMLTKNTIDPKIWDQLKNMKPQEISRVIEAKDGYHIVKLIKAIPASSRSFADVKEEIKSRIFSRRRAAKISELKKRLRAEAKIKNQLDIRYAEIVAELRKQPTPSKRVVGNAAGIEKLPLYVPIKTDEGLASKKSERP
jgi:parvulin-like peptidyl-prolyl isomerase